MEREVGGGIGMGNTCKPMAVLFQCMTKFTTNKKIIIKKREREKKNGNIQCSIKTTESRVEGKTETNRVKNRKQ